MSGALASWRTFEESGPEARLRTLVAERLGVARDDVGAGVSLVDDLAADSLDLWDVALAIEAEFGVRLPLDAVQGVRTCDDLAARVLPALEDEQRPESVAALDLMLRTRITAARGIIARTIAFTPYGIETLAEDALQAGPTSRVEVTVPREARESALVRLRRQLWRLRARGIAIVVEREP